MSQGTNQKSKEKHENTPNVGERHKALRQFETFLIHGAPKVISSLFLVIMSMHTKRAGKKN